jgi:hypothetical protein
MAKNHKVPEQADQRVSLADKIGFSLMVRAKFDALQENPWAAPEEFSALMDQFGDDYENYPWCHPEFASYLRQSSRGKSARVAKYC